MFDDSGSEWLVEQVRTNLSDLKELYVIEAGGARHYKTYRIYQKDL